MALDQTNQGAYAIPFGLSGNRTFFGTRPGQADCAKETWPLSLARLLRKTSRRCQTISS